MENFRGLRKVVMVDVREGSGTNGDPARIVHYIYDLEQHGGSHGGLVGTIDPHALGMIANESKSRGEAAPNHHE